jgi:hypothetical protein
MFRRNISLQSSGSKKKVQQKTSKQACHLLACWFLVELTRVSLTLKIEAICSSEKSADTQRTTWGHIPEDDTLPDGTYDETLTEKANVMATHLSITFTSNTF